MGTPVLTAFTAGGSFTQIETNVREFKTKGGNGAGGTLEGFIREFGRPSSDETISGTTSRVVTLSGNSLFLRVMSDGTVLTVGVIR